MNETPTGGLLARRRSLVLAMATGGAAVVGAVAQFALSGETRVLVTLIGLVGLIFLACLASVMRAWQAGPEAPGWKILSLSLFSNGVIQAARIPNFLGYPLPVLSRDVSIVLQVLGALLLVGMLLAWHLNPRSRFDRVRNALDGLLFALAVLFILWCLVLGPVFFSDRFPMAERILWLTTFLVYDLLLGLAVYFGLAEPSRFQGPLGWISVALLLASLHNFKWLLDVLSGSVLFHFPFGPLVYCVPLTYLAAALSPRPVGTGTLRPGPVGLIHMLPYIPLVGATALGVGMLVTGPSHGHNLILVWIAFGLVVVLLVRQGFALWDYFKLSQHLETRVAERTAALEKAQAMLLRTERMNAMATLGAGLSHDMNNLLCAIQSRTELVIMDLDEGNLPNREDMVRLQEATQHAATLGRRLMAFGRQEEKSLECMDLADELLALRPMLQVLLPRNVTLHLENATGPMPFLGTPGILEQILVNLISNARDAMPDGGCITIRAWPPRLEEDALGPLLEIEDTGNGIPADLQPRLFEPFFTTKASGKGTGLGLVSVKLLLLKAGGSISFTSRVGQGTTFQIRLPRRP